MENGFFKDLELYSEVLQDSVPDLVDIGKVRAASGSALTLSTSARKRFFNELYRYVDHSEHSVNVVVTEHGLVDTRPLTPRQVAEQVIKKCAHPAYRDLLWDYFQRAVRETGGHEPHLLGETFFCTGGLKKPVICGLVRFTSCKQAYLARLGVFEKFFRCPDDNALDQFLLVDLHHVHRHLAGDQLDTLDLSHFLKVGQARDVGLFDLFLHHPGGQAHHTRYRPHDSRWKEFGAVETALHDQIETHEGIKNFTFHSLPGGIDPQHQRGIGPVEGVFYADKRRSFLFHGHDSGSFHFFLLDYRPFAAFRKVRDDGSCFKAWQWFRE
jgi:hypothetical protein